MEAVCTIYSGSAEEKDIVLKCHAENGVYTVGIYGADGILRALVELK